MTVTLANVKAAASAIDGAVRRTPCEPSRTLSEITGAQIFVKFENLQYTASFKERGALNKLLTLTGKQRKAGVVAMSAGNHAQGVAYHAGRLGIPATVVMPRHSPFSKVGHARALGARVVLEGDDFDGAAKEANRLAADEGLTFVHPFDDDRIIAGQGTLALEMLEAQPDRVVKVTGRAAQDPLIAEDPSLPQNRRISIVLLRGATVLPSGLAQ